MPRQSMPGLFLNVPDSKTEAGEGVTTNPDSLYTKRLCQKVVPERSLSERVEVS